MQQPIDMSYKLLVRFLCICLCARASNARYVRPSAFFRGHNGRASAKYGGPPPLPQRKARLALMLRRPLNGPNARTIQSCLLPLELERARGFRRSPDELSAANLLLPTNKHSLLSGK